MTRLCLECGCERATLPDLRDVKLAMGACLCADCAHGFAEDEILQLEDRIVELREIYGVKA